MGPSRQSKHPRTRLAVVAVASLAAVAVSTVSAVLGTLLVPGMPASASAPVPAQFVSDPDLAAPLLPEVSLLVTDAYRPLDEDGRRSISGELGAIDGVTRVSATPVPQPGSSTDLSVFYLTLEATISSGADVDVVVAAASAAILAEVPSARVLVGGAATIDGAVAQQFGAPLLVLVVVAAAVGLALGVVFGWQRGLVGAVTLTLSVFAGAVIGRQAGGEFDGSLASTAIPGAVAALVVGTGGLTRLLYWFRNPAGADGAEKIRRAVRSVLPEYGLVVAVAAIGAMGVGPLDPGPTPLTPLAVGAAVAAAIQFGMTAPALTLLTSARESNPNLLPFSVPDGRDLPLLVISGVVAFLVALSLVGLRQPESGRFGLADLGRDHEAAVVAETLRVGGGDASSAVIAIPSAVAGPDDVTEWAEATAELTTVEWVQVGPTRFTSVDASALTQDQAPLDPEIGGVAVVVPVAATGSALAAQMLQDVSAVPLVGGPPILVGPTVDAASVEGDRLTVAAAVVLLAVAGAGAVRLISGSTGHAVVALVLRLLGGGAVLGLFGVMGRDATAATIVTVVGAGAIAATLIDLEFVSGRRRWGPGADQSRPTPAQAGIVGLLALGLGALGLAVLSPLQSAPAVGLAAVVLLPALVLELTVGALLLRPALLGQGPAFHTAVRPFRVALHSGLAREAIGGEDPQWRPVIEALVQAEFELQSAPVDAVLSNVFVPDTPLYRQAAAHHATLAGAGLRILGAHPQLQTVRSVGKSGAITVAVTVDHPARHLVDGNGTVVGTRRAERRSGMLWLSRGEDGAFRIAESVELGSARLPERQDNDVGMVEPSSTVEPRPVATAAGSGDVGHGDDRSFEQ